jgi:hypothetical protein
VSFVVRKTLRVKPRTTTKVIPYIVELSDKNNLNVDHVYSMCTTILETEAATFAVQMVMVLLKFGKFKPK